jgi:hypothetical protein
MQTFSLAAKNMEAAEFKWIRYKDTIHDIYIKQNKPLGGLMDEMKVSYNFQAR